MVGMNTDEVNALAAQMDSAASEIESTMNQVTTKLRGTTWVGADRDKFESEWNSSAIRQLQLVKQLLTEASSAARRNAQEQQAASSA